MRISAVIPLYNKAGAVERALRSVFQQTRLPDVLVVVDDGSSDNSAQICRAVLSEAPSAMDCRLITQENAGVSVARNAGAEATDTDVIAFLDADDEWLPQHLAEIERLANAYPDAGLLSTRRLRFGSNGQLVPDTSALPRGFFGLVENALLVYSRGYGIIWSSAVAITRAAWARSSGFPPGERKSQDIHLWLRLLLHESFAHSDVCTSIFHEADSGVGLRKGVVPAHFSYFLDNNEGRQYLSNPELRHFLATNMANSVAVHRLLEDKSVVAELRRMSGQLGCMHRLKVHAIALVPRSLLVKIAERRRRKRETALP